MLVAFLRTFILYLVIIFGMRLMGKRQLGELQPSELVITIIISNIATLPIEEIQTPLFLGLLPILSLVTFEVIISTVNLKVRWMRRLFYGKPAIVVQDGVVDQKKLRDLRFSADDLMAQLRSLQIYSLDEVDFAMVETTGKLSVYQKYQNRPLTPQVVEMPDQPAQNSPAYLLISDGVIYTHHLDRCGQTQAWLDEVLASHRVVAKEVFILTADKTGTHHLVKKEAVP